MGGQVLASARQQASEARRYLKPREARKGPAPLQKDVDSWEAVKLPMDEKWEVVSHPVRDAEERVEEMERIAAEVQAQMAKIQKALEEGRSEKGEIPLKASGTVSLSSNNTGTTT